MDTIRSGLDGLKVLALAMMAEQRPQAKVEGRRLVEFVGQIAKHIAKARSQGRDRSRRNQFRAAGVASQATGQLRRVLLNFRTDQSRVVVRDHEVRIGFEKLDLQLQLALPSPKVVAFAKGDVPASASVHRAAKIPGHAQIDGRAQDSDLASQTLAIALKDLWGRVGAAVVAHDDLDIEIGDLRQERVERVADVVGLVVGDAQDAQQGHD